VIILVALARPHAQISLPRVEGTVMLVVDVSASMGATDAEPTRLEAAKTVAREFVLSQPETVQIGIVSFSGSGFTVQAPTNDANTLLNTIERLEPTSGTSLGQGILSALHTIAVDAGLVTGESTIEGDAAATPPAGEEAQPPGSREEAALAQLPEGIYPASVIVLLSDGENNQSIEPLRVAEAAAEHGVRIDALGFGTTAGATLQLDGFSVHTALDEAALQQITQAAGGTYYPTQGEQDLEQVYASLTPQLVVKPEAMEITSVLAGASILILLVGSLFSMLWFNRLL
jgi:Ca-activated chloride channel family protein